MAYTKTIWENSPSTNSPINANNLNKIEQGIYDNSLKTDEIGDLTNLDTFNKTNIVSAINNVVASGTGYIKYLDGTMITYQEESKTISCTNQWGNLYYGTDSTTYNFPQAFISAPTVISSVKSATATGCIDGSYDELIITETSVKNFSILRPTSNSSVSVKISILAIGKWK